MEFTLPVQAWLPIDTTHGTAVGVENVPPLVVELVDAAVSASSAALRSAQVAQGATVAVLANSLHVTVKPAKSDAPVLAAVSLTASVLLFNATTERRLAVRVRAEVPAAGGGPSGIPVLDSQGNPAMFVSHPVTLSPAAVPAGWTPRLKFNTAGKGSGGATFGLLQLWDPPSAEYGYACLADFSAQSADVLCGALGFSGAGAYSYFTNPPTTRGVPSIACAGDATGIEQCLVSAFAVNPCPASDSAAVGLVCSPARWQALLPPPAGSTLPLQPSLDLSMPAQGWSVPLTSATSPWSVVSAPIASDFVSVAASLRVFNAQVLPWAFHLRLTLVVGPTSSGPWQSVPVAVLHEFFAVDTPALLQRQASSSNDTTLLLPIPLRVAWSTLKGEQGRNVFSLFFAVQGQLLFADGSPVPGGSESGAQVTSDGFSVQRPSAAGAPARARLVGQTGVGGGFGGSGPGSGGVAVQAEEVWTPLCSDGFGSLDAAVACSEGGLARAGAAWAAPLPLLNAFGSSTTGLPSAWVLNTACTGGEDSVLSCPHSLVQDSKACVAGTVANVQCFARAEDAPHVPLRLLGVGDNTSALAGVVQVQWPGVPNAGWSALCLGADTVSQTTADTICWQAGLGNATVWGTSTAVLGAEASAVTTAAGSAAVSSVHCLGGETQIGLCPRGPPLPRGSACQGGANGTLAVACAAPGSGGSGGGGGGQAGRGASPAATDPAALIGGTTGAVAFLLLLALAAFLVYRYRTGKAAPRREPHSLPRRSAELSSRRASAGRDGTVEVASPLALLGAKPPQPPTPATGQGDSATVNPLTVAASAPPPTADLPQGRPLSPLRPAGLRSFEPAAGRRAFVPQVSSSRGALRGAEVVLPTVAGRGGFKPPQQSKR